MAEPQEIVIRVVVEGAGASSPSPTPDDFEPVTEGPPHTPSQELRWALRRRWLKKQGGTDDDFEPYYKDQMQRIVEVVDRQTKGK